MKIQMDINNFINTELPSMCGKRQLYFQIFIDKGWTALRPIQEAKTQLVSSDSILDELEWHNTELCKEYIGGSDYPGRERREMLRQAKLTAKQSGNYLDRIIPKYNRIVTEKLNNEDAEQNALVNKIRQAIDEERRNEYRQHPCTLYKNYNTDSAENRMSLYKDVMIQGTEKLGFEFDKKISVKARPLFTKPLFGKWKFVIAIEKNKLCGPKGWIVSGNTQGTIEIRCGIVHESNKGLRYNDSDTFNVIEFSNLFDLGIKSFGLPYLFVENLMDIELLLQAHIDMYAIIQKDYEGCVITGFSKAKDKNIDIL